MVDQARFFRYVEEAFARLDDRPFLLAHPLPALLATPGQTATPDLLRRVILAAIDQLRPPDGTPDNQANWRRWRGLTLRYVKGLTTKQIAQQLLISERQARRDHESGVGAVAALLWSAYLQRANSRQPRMPTVPTRTDVWPLASPVQAEENDQPVVASQPVERTTNLAEAIESALGTINSLARDRLAKVEVTIPDGGATAAASPSAVRQVLLCLLTAVIREDTSRQIHLACGGDLDRIRLTITVGNRRTPWAGPIAAEDQALIAAARHLVEAEGGTIELEEDPGQVPGLVLSLPAKPNVRVLVVDDNPDVVQLFRRFLAGRRYHLAQARTPPTALALAREFRPDVIILDVLMPSQDGWQILQQIRSDPGIERVPVIICSILPERPLAMALAAADFLAKPVTPQSLLTALERCLAEPDSTKSPDFPEGTAPSRQWSSHRLGSH